MMTRAGTIREATFEEMQQFKPMRAVVPARLRKLMTAHVDDRRHMRKIAKEQITLRLDAVILDHFRSGGPGWQTRINDALRGLI